MPRSFRRRRMAAALAGSCPAIAAQQVPPLGRGRESRGQSRTPRFCWAALSSTPPAPPALPSPGVAGSWGLGVYQALAPQLPVCRTRFFSSPLKDKVRRGKACKARMLSGAALGRCFQLLFPGGVGGCGGGESICECPKKGHRFPCP